MNRNNRTLIALGLCIALLGGLLALDTAFAQEKKKKAIKTGNAAGIGALVGFALGGDPLWGAASGAALGAAGGMIANQVVEGKQEKKAAAAQQTAEQDTQIAARDQRIADLERELLEAERAREEAQNAIIEAVGPDVWEGYKSLRGCQHERAYALAKVGAVSQDPYHRLGGLWLEAMTAVDQSDRQKADLCFQSLAERDPEIDTVQQASLATDQAVLDMRTERAEIGIGPCR
jgi:hypothetical protein